MARPGLSFEMLFDLIIVAWLAVSTAALSLPGLTTRRETLGEAAHNARRIVRDVTTGTMASVFPDTSDLAGRPFAMMEYHAPCYANGSLTFILMPISRSTQNILREPSHHATYTVSMPTDGVRSPMSRGRVALMGNMTVLSHPDKHQTQALESCYTRHHPDARYWLPGRAGSPHMSIWARLDVDSIYYVGVLAMFTISGLSLSIYTPTRSTALSGQMKGV